MRSRVVLALVVVVTVVVASVLSSSEVSAQPGPELLATERSEIEELEKSARARTGGGLVLAILGAGVVAGGGYLLYCSSQPVEETDDPFDDLGESLNGLGAIGGLGLAILGTGVAVTGIAVFASGQSRQAEAKRRKHQLRFGPTNDGGFAATLSGSLLVSHSAKSSA